MSQMMQNRPGGGLERNDVHNASVNIILADAGYCGMTHLPTGRVCILGARHVGACDFHRFDEATAILRLDHPDSAPGSEA